MPQFDRFIDNLVEMRSHYSKQIQQSDRSINLAKDSLVHINALLVNELLSNQPFVENLTQMKSHYQSIIEENDRVSSGARVQLNHLNALLAEQLIIQQGNEQAISLPASFVNDEPVIAEKMGGGEGKIYDKSKQRVHRWLGFRLLHWTRWQRQKGFSFSKSIQAEEH